MPEYTENHPGEQSDPSKTPSADELTDKDLEQVTGGSGGTSNIGRLGPGGPGPAPKSA
ncbi:bacteriocin [Granulicella sibirica]|uniref:Uncharacterized protein n=1 Tax=Granulicella sibirica TaxID=2479048 RepID=A0A4Q0SZ17_9BACT|nr:bacteriocin [Granulicella sibirica]RXH54306.1 hypothetical protein GRAN_4602 [Granulicella sibirica]